MLKIDLVIIAIESPLVIGIYVEEILIESTYIDGQTSEVLPFEFQKIKNKYDIQRVLFANGPGSFMAIKINYVFLRTVSIVSGIKLFSQDAFFFNSNTPVKALNKMYFIRKNGKIVIEKMDVVEKVSFLLPNKFEVEKYSEEIEPLYILPVT